MLYISLVILLWKTMVKEYMVLNMLRQPDTQSSYRKGIPVMGVNYKGYICHHCSFRSSIFQRKYPYSSQGKMDDLYEPTDPRTLL